MRSLLRRIPGARSLKRRLQRRLNPMALNEFLTRWPPGHFYSPIPAATDLDGQGSDIVGPRTTQVPGIDLCVDAQLGLLAELGRFAEAQPFTRDPNPKCRYYYNNDRFCFQDAVILYGMLRRFQPRRVIEVGSGYSSAVMLDVNDLFLGDSVQFTFIEPYPDQLHSLMRPQDRALLGVRRWIHEQPVQNVPVEVFDQLELNDMLFIDSSHVGKVGSDVLHLLTQIVPRIKPGVIVHIHDIFWPFDYPSVWLAEGRAWNEAYLVRAFLQFNDAFCVLLFNDYLTVHHRAAMAARFPLALSETGASLWLQRAR